MRRANPQRLSKHSYKVKTGKKDIGEMMIEVPEHRDQAVNMSSDSLGRTHPLYFNFNCNFDLSANNSGGDSTAAAEEPQAVGPGAQSGEGFISRAF